MASVGIFHITVQEVSKETKSESKLKVTKSYQQFNFMSCNKVFNILGILMACIIIISFQTTIPRHNSILQPNYWFEMNIPAAMGAFLMNVARMISYFVLMGDRSFISIQYFLKMYFLTMFVWVSSYCTCYVLWVIHLDYRHPMPFVGSICYFLTEFICIGLYSIAYLYLWQGGRTSSRL